MSKLNVQPTRYNGLPILPEEIERERKLDALRMMQRVLDDTVKPVVDPSFRQMEQELIFLRQMFRDREVETKFLRDADKKLRAELHAAMRINRELQRMIDQVVAERDALKVKHEPAPPPAPVPWGRRFCGGVGSAIER